MFGGMTTAIVRRECSINAQREALNLFTDVLQQ